jgi:Spy/CpxP family protein refolding chaperone
MLICRRARRLIRRTIDDETLPAEARALLRGHLARCAPCRDEYETQHEVRRLLALQIECRPPAGFAGRLDARLAREPDRRPAGQSLGGPPLPAPPGWSDLASACETCWRRRGVRLLSAAAALTLIVAGTHVPDFSVRPAAPPVASPEEVPTSVWTESTVRRSGVPAPRDPRPRPTRVPVTMPAEPLVPAVDRSSIPHAGVEGGAILDSSLAGPAAESTDSHHPVELFVEPPKLAPELAEELRLSDTQRKQIEAIYDTRHHALHVILDSTRRRVELEGDEADAAVERVLTPDQRKQYRERRGSEASGVVTRTGNPVSPAHLSLTPRPPTDPAGDSPPASGRRSP